ncbi:hypothetical protein PR048_011105 [Dryococelus australis]|uniref:Uncharacterized protein n=1 Tax=Dryococelus australis TaxID=614101 RepID=A0ABQ9HKP9_9NEOP|nr:hypothetical protein PR048_011105 [Dryococelus australis]
MARNTAQLGICIKPHYASQNRYEAYVRALFPTGLMNYFGSFTYAVMHQEPTISKISVGRVYDDMSILKKYKSIMS